MTTQKNPPILYKNNQISFIELPAKDIQALQTGKAFFQTVFDWSYTDWGDDYSDTQDSGISSGINADTAHKPTHPLPVVYVENLDDTREKVILAQGIITRDIFSFPGGKRFHFITPCGNELAVWSDR